MSQKNTYTIENGKIKTRSLEAHIVDHCNLSCEGCCSLSPFLPAAITAPEILANDFELASHVLEPTWLKLVGGEPLLHPDIDSCIDVAKTSKIASIVSITTNGLLLPKMSRGFWQSLDALTISLYPTPKLPDATIALIHARAAEFNVRLNWKKQDNFVDMDRAVMETDPEANQQVFEACWLRRRCHLVRDGYFYTCTRPVHYQTMLQQHSSDAGYAPEDGIDLRPRPTLLDELHQYLTRTTPLQSCSRCYGGNAPEKPHRQMGKNEVRIILSKMQ